MRFLIGLLWLITTPTYALSPFATQADGQGIIFAQYQDDLDIYPHRIMGSIQEKDTLRVRNHSGEEYQISVSGTGHVFEDVKPHIGDVDGDGLNDVMVVETSLKLGASISIYSTASGTLKKIVQTPYVGRPSRWYSPVGIGDFDGNGSKEIAFVDRPHLARVLRVFSFRGGRFEQVAAAKGLTNHAIGDEQIWGGVRRCDGRDAMIVRQISLDRVVALTVSAGKITGQQTGIRPSPAGFVEAMRCP